MLDTRFDLAFLLSEMNTEVNLITCLASPRPLRGYRVALKSGKR
jgi:hypothetical protein